MNCCNNFVHNYDSWIADRNSLIRRILSGVLIQNSTKLFEFSSRESLARVDTAMTNNHYSDQTVICEHMSPNCDISYLRRERPKVNILRKPFKNAFELCLKVAKNLLNVFTWSSSALDDSQIEPINRLRQHVPVQIFNIRKFEVRRMARKLCMQSVCTLLLQAHTSSTWTASASDLMSGPYGCSFESCEDFIRLLSRSARYILPVRSTGSVQFLNPRSLVWNILISIISKPSS